MAQKLLAAVVAVLILVVTGWIVYDLFQPPDHSPAGADGAGQISDGSRPATRSHYTLQLPGAPAATYSAEPDQISDSPLAQAIHQRFPRIRVAPCLERAASVFVKAAPKEEIDRLPLAFAEFTMHWAGCPDPALSYSILKTTESDQETLFEEVAEQIEGGPYTHIGAARAAAAPPYRWQWVVFLVERLCRLKPIPTSGEPGTTLPLQLYLDPRLSSARLIVTMPRGQIQEIDVGHNGGWVVVGVPLADQVGSEWVEVVAERGQGPELVVLFPIEVGRQPPQLWVGEAIPDERWITTIAEAEELAAGLIARDRERFGRSPLVLDPLLCRIARSHSEDMAAAGYFAHISPTTGSISNRLERESYPVLYAAENIAMSPFIADGQDSLMRSPGHRAAILSTRVTHFGVGVTRTRGEDEGYLITQVFAEPRY